MRSAVAMQVLFAKVGDFSYPSSPRRRVSELRVLADDATETAA
jgi:hypothetical protein